MKKVIQCKDYSIHVNDSTALNRIINEVNPSSVFVIIDENTEKHCLYKLVELVERNVDTILIKSGEEQKTIDTCKHVWQQLVSKGADRSSLILNLGGGVIGDLGGFCASTYMRGIKFIQIPTTLLSQVDASVGGKLGVDFNQLKNMVGLFTNPVAVVIFTDFLDTLPYKELLSGFAELLKHGLIADQKIWKQLSSVDDIKDLDFEEIVFESVMIKKKVTEQDPFEKGLRKILNFGHTVGHAVETLSFKTDQPLLHGEAIAIGMVIESYCAMKLGTLDVNAYDEIKSQIKRLYGNKHKSLPELHQLIQIMNHDKKNQNNQIMYSLLDGIGKGNYNQVVPEEYLNNALLDYKN